MAKMATEEVLAEMERLSQAYVPDQKVVQDLNRPMQVLTGQKGDLVGIRISSSRLTEEYSKADAVYANKTKVCVRCGPSGRLRL